MVSVDFEENEINYLEKAISKGYATGEMNDQYVHDYLFAMRCFALGKEYIVKEIQKPLKEENKILRKEIATSSNTSLVKEIKSALKRINKGEFVGEKEFFEKYIQ